ncbi:hypothetical protein CDAR_542041 [Caerostris darwini]|uniref:Uncharacterized protein n=1 Tax=Caerostris darwini TaxID=1538125 RepID=A0AAV4UUM8_9ARAC|nr:hypothetical protein CDAR_542041 [Caerostris darwini]
MGEKAATHFCLFARRRHQTMVENLVRKKKKNDVREELLHCLSVATRIIDHVRYAARKDSFVEDAYLLILFCSRETELGMLVSEDGLEYTTLVFEILK